MFKIINGNMIEELDMFEENSIDSIVTDPPYELNFMSKCWDNSGISFQKETWKKCFRVLKPGGYLLAFGAPRLQHRIACAIEDAGFEIRDTIMWIYGSGFSKSMNLSKQFDKRGNSDMSDVWRGFGTSLKPSYEPIIMSRKPVEGTVVDNVVKYGVGGINIDECRIPLESDYQYKETSRKGRSDAAVFNSNSCGFDNSKNTVASADPSGRFPANVILTYGDSDYAEVCGGFPNSGTVNTGKHDNLDGIVCSNKETYMISFDKQQVFSNYNNSGSACRYFYCPKASNRDRDEGLDNFETKQATGGGGGIGDYLNDVNSASGKYGSEKAPHKNYHPTVKPTSLMQYLVRLVSPKGATILDPFMGSGSTGKAVAYENNDRDANYNFIGIELSKEYCEIADARIKFAMNDKQKLECCKDEHHKNKEQSDTYELNGKLF